MGVSESWIDRIERASPSRPHAYMINRLEIDSPSCKVLKELDILLAIDDVTFSTPHQLEPRFDIEASKTLTILRSNEEMVVNVPVSVMDECARRRVISFAGAIIHEPHRAVYQQYRHSLPSRLYIISKSRGSPAEMYGLQPSYFITHVNGRHVVSLDDFEGAIKEVESNEYVRVKCLTFGIFEGINRVDLIPTIVSVKMNFHYFPSARYVRESAGSCWRRELIQ
jgi:hypothetical protein